MIITRLEDARALKRMNVPLNTPVEERTFSPEYSDHWIDMMNAHTRFMIAVREYSDGERAGTPGKWRLVKRRLKALDEAGAQCAAFLGDIQDEHEYHLLATFLAKLSARGRSSSTGARLSMRSTQGPR